MSRRRRLEKLERTLVPSRSDGVVDIWESDPSDPELWWCERRGVTLRESEIWDLPDVDRMQIFVHTTE